MPLFSFYEPTGLVKNGILPKDWLSSPETSHYFLPKQDQDNGSSCGQGCYCSIAGICFSVESKPELSYINLGTQTPQAKKDENRTLSFWFFSMVLVGRGRENIISCCLVCELVKELQGKHDDGSIRAECIPAFIVPLILFLYLYVW